MRSNIIFVRGIPLLAVLLLLLAFTSTAFADDISKLREKAMNEGQVQLIVGLQLPAPFIPEGNLASPEAVEQQRKAIMRAREQFFKKMSSHAAGEYEQYAEWGSLPYVALKVSAAALEHLVNNPLVTTIQEDAPEDPHLESATAHIGADVTSGAGYGGLGQTVVILDTGIDVNHPFYGGRVVTEACWSNAGGLGIGISLCPGGGNTQTGIGSADALTGQCWQTVLATLVLLISAITAPTWQASLLAITESHRTPTSSQSRYSHGSTTTRIAAAILETLPVS